MKKQTVGDRIKKYREKLDISQSALAKMCGWSQSRIGNYEANVRDVDSTTAQILSQKLGITPSFLMFGENEGNIDNSYISKIKEGFVFVKGEAVMGADGAFEMDEGFNGKLKFYSDDPCAFALRVKGDSMFPRINSGEFVVIEPRISPCPGDEVLIRTKDGRNMIKKLEFHRDSMYRFASVNQDHPPLTIEDNLIEKVMFVSAIVKSARYIDDI